MQEISGCFKVRSTPRKVSRAWAECQDQTVAAAQPMQWFCRPRLCRTAKAINETELNNFADNGRAHEDDLEFGKSDEVFPEDSTYKAPKSNPRLEPVRPKYHFILERKKSVSGSNNK